MPVEPVTAGSTMPPAPRFVPREVRAPGPVALPTTARIQVGADRVITTWSRRETWVVGFAAGPVEPVVGGVVVFGGVVLYAAGGVLGNLSASRTRADTAAMAARTIITRLDSRRCRRCCGRERGR